MSTRSSPLLRPLVDAAVGRALRTTLVGRERVEGQSEKGRFTKEDCRRLLARAWTIQTQLAPAIAVEPTFGARINVWLASLTLAFYHALLEDGMDGERAARLVADTAWLIYRSWGRLPWLDARLATHDPLRRLRICTDLFRRFPFNPPSYLMEDARSDTAVTFSVRRCPVAEFFASQGASDVCVRTWYALDYPLAEMWGGRLERSGTIGGGALSCDLEWHPRPSEASARVQEVRTR